MKEKYIELMQKSLSAYSKEHVIDYFDRVKSEGLTEHGFPRLTVNIGTLISRGKVKGTESLFLEMMDFCCENIPKVKAANDFSVWEIVSCIKEVENSGFADKNRIEKWKKNISTIEPTTCYSKFALVPEDKPKNWALFTGVSEFFRMSAGLGGTMDFIETQIASQLYWIDENGMYLDGDPKCWNPMMYDVVPRGLFALLLNQGYKGKYYKEIDALLKKAGLLTLKMQSACGEVAFGGRSNQMIFAEGWLAVIYEYEAKRYYKEGNVELASRFKSAIKMAVEQVEYWLNKEPIHHVKNRYPIETFHGCEEYAYFDKYMITTASVFYGASLVCDDDIHTEYVLDNEPTAFATTSHFHKLFIKSGGYSAQFELNAEPYLDSSGLGRIHRRGAPTTVCMSVPCFSEKGYCKVCIDKQNPISLCVGTAINNKLVFAHDEKAEYEVLNYHTDKTTAYAKICTTFYNGETVVADYSVSEKGVDITVCGNGEIAFMLPAFYFDGESYIKIAKRNNKLSVYQDGWCCKYICSHKIFNLNRIGANRNGLYKAYAVRAENKLSVRIEITKE